MSAGTITLTNKSAVVSGNGTSFTKEVAAGDFIVVTVGGIPYTLPVKTVNSNTSLTLVSNFTGPTQAGAAWSAVPLVALNMVTAALVTQSAEALRGLNYDKQNWQQIFSNPATATVKLPDGSSFTGPSWKYLSDNMATKSGGAVPVNQGGTGGKSKDEARASLSAASSGANTDITSLSGLTTPLAVSQGGTGATTESGVRQKIGAAASGRNSDISQISGLQIPVTSITSIPGDGSRGIFAESLSPANYDVVTKTLLSGLKTNNWSLYSSFGMYGGGSGAAALAGPAVCVTDGGSFGARWFFRVSGSVISTANGDITPSVSDERVKNIIREITEEEAVAFITGVRPIRYALKWTPDQVKVGYSAQNIESLDPEIISTSALSVYNPDDGSTVTYEDGKILDPGEVGAAYLVPVVQQLLRRVSELEAEIKTLNPQGS